MAASSDSDNKKSRKDELGGSKDDRSETGAGSTELALVSSSAPAGNGTGGVPPAASPATGAGTAAASVPAAAAAAAASAAAGKERDYIWTEDAVHVLLDHFLEKYMSYEKGMIRNADWVEIAQRVNQQLEGNKPVKTPEQCKNKVDNLKKQYRKERRRGSLGPTSTNWAFFSRMHDIFESDYKKTGAEPPSGGGGGGGGPATAAAAEEVHPSSNNAANNNTSTEEAVHRMRSAAGMQPDHHYLASREFMRKQHEEMMQYKRPPSRRSETPPPPPVAPNPISAAHYHQIHQLMLMPETHIHHSSNHHRDSSSAPRKKAKSDKHHHQQHQQPQLHHEAPHGIPQRHHHHHQAEGSGGAPSSDSGGGGVPAAAEGSSKYHRKLHRHQLAELRQNFMEGFTGFAEVMLKIEVAKMEMQRDLERQRAEMELHRTQMMLSNQLQLARYLKSSPLGAVPPGMPHGEFVPNFGFTEGSSGGNTGRLQLAIPIFPDFTALDAVGPYEVLHLLPNVEVLFVSHQPGLYAAGMGMLTLQATASFDQVTRPQILVVPGGIGTRRLLQDRVILDWIRKVHEHTLYTASVCTGSLLLGAAGLLKGIEATTHWNSHDMLAEFGAKPVSARIVRQGKIITAAGVSAGIDMALQLAALLSDEATAKTLQLYIEYDPQPPFDSGSVSKAGPEVVSRAKELSSKRIAHLQAGGRAPA